MIQTVPYQQVVENLSSFTDTLDTVCSYELTQPFIWNKGKKLTSKPFFFFFP